MALPKVYEEGEREKEQIAEMHKFLVNNLHTMWLKKNAAYGDSFHDTYVDLGIISAITRISDKYNRVKTLAKNRNIDVGDESIIDTLLDMANYCIMTVMEIRRESDNKSDKE